MIALALALLFPTDLDVQCQHNCQVSESGAQIVRTYEGFYPFIYADAVGLPTIGFGHQVRPGEHIEQPLLGEAADHLLKSDLDTSARAVNRMVNVTLWQQQFDAVNSWTFNIGAGKLEHSTLLRRINTEQHNRVPEQFLLWAYAGGRKLPGLERRREAEAKMYEAGTQRSKEH